ncbi:putative acetyltransferase [Scopulibacillus darangshiensis]|uniref:Putative acetyltransferase n=1 Tax=Scopulibacillus darangshiensis TaxID=442528 RepID=A0A4R2P4J8_9BACL|nr:N-acetyltransferase [Scopulibacillus darangshiensis]TCP28871.1 putative acetyltransferase [Scopulibacillus darangshiensis]
MYNVRAEQEKDILEIRKVNDLAFGQENEANLIEAIRCSEYFVPGLSLVAETDAHEVIGHILFSVITIETKNGPIQSLALAPLAVKPEYQNQGIGSTLVKEGLKRCRELGHGPVVVLGHSEYYPKFGFIRASENGIKPPFEVSDENFMIYEVKPGALNNIEGTVFYPEAFTDV